MNCHITSTSDTTGSQILSLERKYVDGFLCFARFGEGTSEVNMDHSSTNVVVRLLLLARLSETKHALQDKEAFCCEHNHNLMEVRTGKAPNSPSHAFLPYRLLSPEHYN